MSLLSDILTPMGVVRLFLSCYLHEVDACFGVVKERNVRGLDVTLSEFCTYLCGGRLHAAFGKVKRVNKTIFSDKYLFVTNVVISTTLSGIGDAIEQKWQKTKEKEINQTDRKFDFSRNRNMCLSGITVGILTHKWYKWLDHKYPGRSIDTVTVKVLLDTLVFSPMQITTFFVSMGLLERSRFGDLCQEIYEKGRLLYLFEWVVWAPMQVVNFYFLGPKYRVLFDNAISLVSDVFVSYVKFDRPASEPVLPQWISHRYEKTDKPNPVEV